MAAAASVLERPRLARKARTTSGLEGDLRWESFREILRAWALGETAGVDEVVLDVRICIRVVLD
jgi:hypothetical protein